MQHWSDRYVGIPYVKNQFDCANLAEMVQREVFRKNIALPQHREYTEAKSVTDKFDLMAHQIAIDKDDVAYETVNPEEGDAVLMKARGYFQHIGIYCIIAGEPWVLHANDSAKQVTRIRIRDLAIRGIKVEGYYKWK